MKERRIHRVNFIAKKGIVLDYQHMAFLFVAWLLFLAFVTGVQYFRLWMTGVGVQKAKTHLAALMQDQERRLAMLQLSGPKVDRTKQQDLIAMFESPPRWSRVLKELQERIPPHVRIVQVKSTEDIKEGRFWLRVEGLAPSMRSVAEFMQRAQSSTLFRDVSIVEARRSETDKRIFIYAIEMQVSAGG